MNAPPTRADSAIAWIPIASPGLRVVLRPLRADDATALAAVLGDGDGTNGSHFLEARQLTAPAGFADDELGGDRRRWSVKARFDFSEFAA